MFSVSTCRRVDVSTSTGLASTGESRAFVQFVEGQEQLRSAAAAPQRGVGQHGVCEGCHGMPWDAMGWDKVQHHYSTITAPQHQLPADLDRRQRVFNGSHGHAMDSSEFMGEQIIDEWPAGEHQRKKKCFFFLMNFPHFFHVCVHVLRESRSSMTLLMQPRMWGMQWWMEPTLLPGR